MPEPPDARMIETAFTRDSNLEAEAAHAKYRAISRFENLDGLRFICIFMVVWHHNAPLDGSYLQIFGRGFLGVDLFFVISGFLITTLLLREADRKGRFSMRNFYMRRALRILPAYFFLITCVSVYFIVVKGRSDLQGLPVYYYMFLSNFLTEHIPLLSITWSLSVEEQYYLIWPLLLMIVPSRFIVPVCVMLIAVNVAVATGALGIEPLAAGPLLFRLPNATYAPIILGSLAAILLHRRPGFVILYTLAGARTAATFGFITLVVLMQMGPADVLGLPNLLIHLTMTFVLIALVVKQKNILTPFLAHPLVARVGAVSYGIYLYHLIALHVVSEIGLQVGGMSGAASFLAYFALSYVMAEVSFRTLEAYFQKFRPS